MGTSNTTKVERIMSQLNILGMYPSAPLASDPGSEPHRPTISIMGGAWGLVREIYIERDR